MTAPQRIGPVGFCGGFSTVFRFGSETSPRRPKPECDVFGRSHEIAIRGQQRQIVPATELNEQRINRADLHSATTARISHLCRLDVILPVRLQERNRHEPFHELVTGFRARETLQQLLHDEARCEDVIRADERGAQRRNLRRGLLAISAKRQRPDAGIDKNVHRRRDRSDL